MLSLEELRRIAEAATPGPWFPGTGMTPHAESQQITSATGNICGMHDGGQTYDSLMANRDHIATFDPPTVLALLDVVEAARHLAGVQFTDHLTAPEHWTPLNAALSRLEAHAD